MCVPFVLFRNLAFSFKIFNPPQKKFCGGFVFLGADFCGIEWHSGFQPLMALNDSAVCDRLMTKMLLKLLFNVI